MAGAPSRRRPVADRRLDELQRGGARAGSAQYRQDPGEIERRLRACNAFQVGFLTQLIGQGVEAVAFNFGAGIFATAEHYGQFFFAHVGYLHLPGLPRVWLAGALHCA